MVYSRRRISVFLIWTGVALMMAVPVLIAATSPYLPYRNTAYIVGGFAGIVALALFLVQPLLGAGYLPGAEAARGRMWHRLAGAAIVACGVLHICGLYLTSAADTLDALLLVAPTPFSVYGVIAMWGIVLTALLALLRRRLRVRNSVWRLIHHAVALVVVVATVVHALMIEGAMESVSKWILCLAVLISTGIVLLLYWAVRPNSVRRNNAARKPSD